MSTVNRKTCALHLLPRRFRLPSLLLLVFLTLLFSKFLAFGILANSILDPVFVVLKLVVAELIGAGLAVARPKAAEVRRAF